LDLLINKIYNNNNFTSNQFIMKNFTKYFNITSNTIKNLIKYKNTTLLDNIFRKLKFYDNDFILQLLLQYKNKIAISSSDLNQLISNEKFKILINNTELISDKIFVIDKYNELNNDVNKYLIFECQKKDINIYNKIFN